jgi:hypothetical protein
MELTYEQVPDIEATWFVDPPYATPAGRHYPFNRFDYAALALWCKNRRGQTIVCEDASSTWLPFSHLWSRDAGAGANREGWNCEGIWTSDPPEEWSGPSIFEC